MIHSRRVQMEDGNMRSRMSNVHFIAKDERAPRLRHEERVWKRDSNFQIHRKSIGLTYAEYIN